MDITTRLALQSQATRLTGRVPGGGDRTGQGYDLLRLAVSTTNYTRCPLRNQTQTTIRRPEDADFHIELIPLHSPLLRESLLVSFPPLSNMFKFGGSSRLSSVQGLSLFACLLCILDLDFFLFVYRSIDRSRSRAAAAAAAT